MSEREPERLPPAQAGALYLEHGEQLLAFAMGLLRHRELAREVVQITFGKALEHAGGVPPEARKAWLFRVARNEALAIRRRDGVAQKVQSRLGAGSSSSGEEPHFELLRSEEVQLVRDALDELPPSQRDVVQQKFFEGRTFAQIAKSEGLPLGTVLTRMRLALGKLEQALRKTR